MLLSLGPWRLSFSGSKKDEQVGLYWASHYNPCYIQLVYKEHGEVEKVKSFHILIFLEDMAEGTYLQLQPTC